MWQEPSHQLGRRNLDQHQNIQDIWLEIHPSYTYIWPKSDFVHRVPTLHTCTHTHCGTAVVCEALKMLQKLLFILRKATLPQRVEAQKATRWRWPQKNLPNIWSSTTSFSRTWLSVNELDWKVPFFSQNNPPIMEGVLPWAEDSLLSRSGRRLGEWKEDFGCKLVCFSLANYTLTN